MEEQALNNPLLDKLLEKQSSLGLSNDALARLIGVTPGMWSMVKHGQRRPGIRFIDGVIKAFPELQNECFKYLGLEIPVGQRKLL